MKKSNILLIMFTFISVVAQAQTELFREKLPKEKIPQKILMSLEKDFPNVDIVKYEGLPITLIKGELYVDSDDMVKSKPYDNYVITLDGKSGVISATYDEEGHLMNTFERLVNVALPEEVLVAIGDEFRGWAVKGDKVRMTSYRDGKTTAHYKVRLEKNGKVEYVVFNEKGTVVKPGKLMSWNHKDKEVG